MKITIESDLCDGHGACVDACPEVFALGDDDDVVVLLDQEPDEALRELVEEAAYVCPKVAILVD